MKEASSNFLVSSATARLRLRSSFRLRWAADLVAGPSDKRWHRNEGSMSGILAGVRANKSILFLKNLTIAASSAKDKLAPMLMV